jgi:hypothetical protein
VAGARGRLEAAGMVRTATAGAPMVAGSKNPPLKTFALWCGVVGLLPIDPPRRRRLSLLAALVLSFLDLGWSLSVFPSWTRARWRSVESVASVDRPALVLGCGVEKSGVPSRMLERRRRWRGAMGPPRAYGRRGSRDRRRRAAQAPRPRSRHRDR